MTQPLPVPTPVTAGFWDAARRHELVIQRCGSCGRLRHYPQPMCPWCRSTASSWQQVSGRGTVYTFTVTHHRFHPHWADRTPFAVATIELDEGVRMVTDLPERDVEDIRIGAPVEVFFEDLDEITLPRFRLMRSGLQALSHSAHRQVWPRRVGATTVCADAPLTQSACGTARRRAAPAAA